MTTKKQDATLAGVGVAACAVCCAGPILGFFAAIGLAGVGAALWGSIALVVGAFVAVLVVMRRRRRVKTCAITSPSHEPVEFSITRRR